MLEYLRYEEEKFVICYEVSYWNSLNDWLGDNKLDRYDDILNY